MNYLLFFTNSRFENFENILLWWYVCSRQNEITNQMFIKLLEITVKNKILYHMKKFILLTIALTSSLVVTSCRQDDDFNADELARLELLKKARENANATTTSNIDMMLDGDPVPPPRNYLVSAGAQFLLIINIICVY